MNNKNCPGFRSWLLELLKDERGGTSIKPVITLLGSLILCVSLIVGVWFKDFKPNETLINAIMVITAIGMGADSADKFSYRPRFRFDGESSKEHDDDAEKEDDK